MEAIVALIHEVRAWVDYIDAQKTHFVSGKRTRNKPTSFAEEQAAGIKEAKKRKGSGAGKGGNKKGNGGGNGGGSTPRSNKKGGKGGKSDRKGGKGGVGDKGGDLGGVQTNQEEDIVKKETNDSPQTIPSFSTPHAEHHGRSQRETLEAVVANAELLNRYAGSVHGRRIEFQEQFMVAQMGKELTPRNISFSATASKFSSDQIEAIKATEWKVSDIVSLANAPESAKEVVQDVTQSRCLSLQQLVRFKTAVAAIVPGWRQM